MSPPSSGISPLPRTNTVLRNTSQEQPIRRLRDIKPMVRARGLLVLDADHRRRTKVPWAIAPWRAAEHQAPPRRRPEDVIGRVITRGTEHDIAGDARRTTRIVTGRWIRRGRRRDHHSDGTQDDSGYIDSHYISVARSPGKITISVLQNGHWLRTGVMRMTPSRRPDERRGSCAARFELGRR